MPGEVGNFAIAAHRSAYGGGMHEIEQLQLGDAHLHRDAGRLVHLPLPRPRVRDARRRRRARAGAAPARRCDADRPPHHPDELQPALLDRRAHHRVRRASSRGQPRAAGPPAEIAGDRRDAGRPACTRRCGGCFPAPCGCGVILLLLLVAAVVFALFTWVFPLVDGILTPIEVTVDDMTRVLVIDNYDSFVYTLNGYLQELGAETEVRAQRRVRRSPTCRARIARVRRRAALARTRHARGRRGVDPRSSTPRSRRASRCSASASATRRSPRRSARP